MDDFDAVSGRIAANIKKLREQQGLSQATIGQRVGMDQRTLSKYENAVHRLRVDQLPAFAEALDCSIEELFSGLAEKTVPMVGALKDAGRVELLGGDLEDTEHTTPCPRNLDAEQTVAVYVATKELFPVEQGTMLFFDRPRNAAPDSFLGHLCLVQTTGGQWMIRYVRAGTSIGVYDLHSGRGLPDEDVPLRVAGRIRAALFDMAGEYHPNDGAEESEDYEAAPSPAIGTLHDPSSPMRRAK